jgi:hypothetical protein
MLRRALPAARRVVIPFHRDLSSVAPFGLPHGFYDELETTLRTEGFEVHHVGVADEPGDVKSIMRRAAVGDVVLLRPESGVGTLVHSIITACNTKGCVVVGTGLDLMSQGAAFVYGGRLARYVDALGAALEQVLHGAPLPGGARTAVREPGLVMCNPNAFKAQGGVITPYIKELLPADSPEVDTSTKRDMIDPTTEFSQWPSHRGTTEDERHDETDEH